MLAQKSKNYKLLKKKKQQSVPEWLYEDDFGCCGCTKAALLWWMNVVCAFFHTLLAIATIILSMSNGRTMATPKLQVFLTNLTWIPNATNALIPNYQAAGGLYLSWMVVFFFLLSALAHGSVAAFNFSQAWAKYDTTSRIVTTPYGWYYVWIHECRNPLRWIEYSFSASLMGMVFAVAGGVNHLYMVLQIFGLLFSTMVFGHYAEVVNRPIDRGDSLAMLWQIDSRIERLFPNLLGYVPYAFVWVPLLHSFFWNSSNADQGPPAFVTAIIISQAVLFSCFGLVQFVILFRSDGPSVYFYGEFAYQVLSLAAKGVLGLLLMANVLLYDSFDEAVAAAQ